MAARPAGEPHGSGRRSDRAEGSTGPAGAEPVGPASAEPIDWEARYKEAVAESRKWEGRAKASRAAITKAEKSAEEEIAELRSRLDAKERAEAHAALAAKVR